MPELSWTLIALGALVSATNPPAPAPQKDYGQVETFQPGKRYNCVPTADHKGWNCQEIGKNETSGTPPVATQPAPVRAPPASPPPPKLTLPPATAEPGTTGESNDLPGYLTNPSTRDIVRPSSKQAPAAATSTASRPAESTVATPTRAAPAPAESAPKPKTGQTAPTPKPEPKPATSSPPRSSQPAASPPAPAPNPPPAPVRAEPPTAPIAEHANAGNSGVLDGRAFLKLPADHFVVELAHAASQSGLPGAGGLPALPHGNVYRLHLRQFGNDQWLLVWGDFADVEAARTARRRLVANGAHTGWPRLIAPLQTEVRRAMKPAGP